MAIKDHQIDSNWRNSIMQKLTNIEGYLSSLGTDGYTAPTLEDITNIFHQEMSKMGLSDFLATSKYGNIDVKYEYGRPGPIKIRELVTGAFNRITSSYYDLNNINIYDAIYLSDLDKLYWIQYDYTRDENQELMPAKTNCRIGKPNPLEAKFNISIEGQVPVTYQFNLHIEATFNSVYRVSPQYVNYAIQVHYDTLVGVADGFSVPMIYDEINKVFLGDPTMTLKKLVEKYIADGGTNLPADLYEPGKHTISKYVLVPLDTLDPAVNFMLSNGTMEDTTGLTKLYGSTPLFENFASEKIILDWLNLRITSNSTDTTTGVMLSENYLVDSLWNKLLDDPTVIPYDDGSGLTLDIMTPSDNHVVTFLNQVDFGDGYIDYLVYGYTQNNNTTQTINTEMTATLTDEYDASNPKLLVKEEEFNAAIASMELPEGFVLTRYIISDITPGAVIYRDANNNCWGYPIIYTNTCVIPHEFSYQIKALLKFNAEANSIEVLSSIINTAICGSSPKDITRYNIESIMYDQLIKIINDNNITDPVITYEIICDDLEIILTSNPNGKEPIMGCTLKDTLVPI